MENCLFGVRATGGLNMWPGEVSSDLDVNEESYDNLAGRWSILVDLYVEFQGECGAFLFMAILIPGLLAASVFFEWTQRPLLTLAIGAVVFIICITVSLHSYIWFRWVRKRKRIAFALMQQRGQEELEVEDEGYESS
jgi:hypothetical protein